MKDRVQIFLSYAREDIDRVREIHRKLSDAGFAPWMDEVDLLPGQRWDLEIPKELSTSDFILIFFSQNSVAKRGYVQREFKLVLDTLKEIPEGHIYTIPIRLDNCEIPSQFSDIHCEDLLEEGSFERIVRAIQAGLDQREKNGENGKYTEAKGPRFGISSSTPESQFEAEQTNEQFLFSVSERSDVPMTTLDIELNFVKVNSAFLALVGWARDEIEGKHVKNFLTSESYASVQKRILIFTNRKDTDQKLPRTYQVEFIHKDSRREPVLLENTVFSIWKGENERIGFRVSYRNIAEQKRQRDDNKETIHRAISFLRELVDVTFTVGAGRSIVDVSLSAEQILGFAEEEMREKNLSDYILNEELCECVDRKLQGFETRDFHMNREVRVRRGQLDSICRFHIIIDREYNGMVVLGLIDPDKYEFSGPSSPDAP